MGHMHNDECDQFLDPSIAAINRLCNHYWFLMQALLSGCSITE